MYGSLAEGQNTVLSSKAENEAVIQDLFASVEVIQQTFDAVLSWRDQSRQLYQKGRVLSSMLLSVLFTLFSVTGYCLGSRSSKTVDKANIKNVAAPILGFHKLLHVNFCKIPRLLWPGVCRPDIGSDNECLTVMYCKRPAFLTRSPPRSIYMPALATDIVPKRISMEQIDLLT